SMGSGRRDAQAPERRARGQRKRRGCRASSVRRSRSFAVRSRMPPLRSATACAAAAGKVRAMTTPDFDRSSLEARARAEAEGQEPRLEHYLLALLHPESTAAVDVLRRLGVEPAAVGATVRARMAVQDGGTGMPVAYRVAAWFGQAALEATALDHDRLTTAHLLLAACAERGTVGADALAAHGV